MSDRGTVTTFISRRRINFSAGLDLPYPCIMRTASPFMASGSIRTLMVKLIRADLIELDHFEVRAFDLDHANEAAAHASANSGPSR